jgi:hypothetical protein
MALPLVAAGRRISATAPPAGSLFPAARRPGFLIDGDREAMLSHTVEGKEQR